MASWELHTQATRLGETLHKVRATEMQFRQVHNPQAKSCMTPSDKPLLNEPLEARRPSGRWVDKWLLSKTESRGYISFRHSSFICELANGRKAGEGIKSGQPAIVNQSKEPSLNVMKGTLW
jgi:hypothetical protein